MTGPLKPEAMVCVGEGTLLGLATHRPEKAKGKE